MGWASGSSLFSLVIKSAKKAIPDKRKRVKFYLEMVNAFEQFDWDTQDECIGEDPAYDEAMKTLHPHWFDGSE